MNKLQELVEKIHKLSGIGKTTLTEEIQSLLNSEVEKALNKITEERNMKSKSPPPNRERTEEKKFCSFCGKEVIIENRWDAVDYMMNGELTEGRCRECKAGA